jgi:dihydroxyacetone kinase-like predicted kinase
MYEGAGLLTVIEGEGAEVATTEAVRRWVAEHRPDIEVEVHRGDQPLYPYLFGVE